MTSGNGITNIDIEKFFDNKTNDDFKKNFMLVYLSDSVTKYINFYNIIKEKRAKYPFGIFNQEHIGGAFLIFIQKKDLLLFDSFGFVDFKLFIIDNDNAIIGKMLFNLKKKTPQTIILILYLSPFLSKHTKKFKKKLAGKTNRYCERFFRRDFSVCKIKK